MSYRDIVQKHRSKLAKAEAQVIALEKELDSARAVVLGLRNIVRLVSETVDECQAVAIAEKRVPKISKAVRLWLVGLARVEVFGAAEAATIANANGETISADAVRQRITQLTQLGALVRRSRGQYSVDRDACGTLFGVDWVVDGETDVETEARIARSHDAQIGLDNQIREGREAGRIRRLQQDRSLDDAFSLDSETPDGIQTSTTIDDQDGAPKRPQPQLWDHKYDSNYEEDVPF